MTSENQPNIWNTTKLKKCSKSVDHLNKSTKSIKQNLKSFETLNKLWCKEIYTNWECSGSSKLTSHAMVYSLTSGSFSKAQEQGHDAHPYYFHSILLEVWVIRPEKTKSIQTGKEKVKVFFYEHMAWSHVCNSWSPHTNTNKNKPCEN